MIKPVFEKLAHDFEGKGVFLKIDVDKCEELSANFGIEAMPTFIVVKNGTPIANMRGANQAGLEKLFADNCKWNFSQIKEDYIS